MKPAVRRCRPKCNFWDRNPPPKSTRAAIPKTVHADTVPSRTPIVVAPPGIAELCRILERMYSRSRESYREWVNRKDDAGAWDRYVADYCSETACRKSVSQLVREKSGDDADEIRLRVDAKTFIFRRLPMTYDGIGLVEWEDENP